MTKQGSSSHASGFRVRGLTHEYLNEAMFYYEECKKLDPIKDYWKFNSKMKIVILYSFFSLENYIKRILERKIKNNVTFRLNYEVILENLLRNFNFTLSVTTLIPLLIGKEFDTGKAEWGNAKKLKEWRNKIAHCVPGEGFYEEEKILTLRNGAKAIKSAKSLIRYLCTLTSDAEPKIINQTNYEEII